MGENIGKSGQSGEAARQPTPAEDVRALTRCALTASLATIDQATGYPYASLVTTATACDGTPVMLLSSLARHTRNLLADSRASLLVDGTAGSADPLAGGRATLIGRVSRVADGSAAAARTRFLARHPEAESYADFADFGFFALAPERAHYVGGFGRIIEISGGEIVTSTAGAEALIEAESDIVSHMNEDHFDAVRLYATHLLGQPDDSWRMTGIDPNGADLAAVRRTARLNFAKRVTNPDDARRTLADLARAARGASPRGDEGLT